MQFLLFLWHPDCRYGQGLWSCTKWLFLFLLVLNVQTVKKRKKLHLNFLVVDGRKVGWINERTACISVSLIKRFDPPDPGAVASPRRLGTSGRLSPGVEEGWSVQKEEPESGIPSAVTSVLYAAFMLTNGSNSIKLINYYYYYRLCQSKGSVTIVCFLLSYINWFFSLVHFDGDWIFNPMTKYISPCIVWVALM